MCCEFEIWMKSLVVKRTMPNKGCCQTKRFTSRKQAFRTMFRMHEIQGHLVKVSPRRCQKLTARMELQTAAMLADTMGDNQCPCRSIHGALEPILCAWKMRRSKICSSVWPWNQKPRETRRQHLVRYRSSLKNRKTRRTIKRGRNFQALSTLFCAVAGKTSCWGQKSIPRLLEGPTNVASCSNFPGAQF